MNSKALCETLERDFVRPGMTDEWAKYMGSISEFLCPQFKERSIGLVCDFAAEVSEVRTAVFPSAPVMRAMLDQGLHDAMLFLHHPSIVDIRRAPEIFYQMDKDLLRQFHERKISVFAFHVPLDNFGEYSTSVTLARALELKIDKAFAPYGGGLCGVFGDCAIKTVPELSAIFSQAVGHKTSLYANGDSEILGGKVAVIAGGGNSVKFLEDVAKAGINTFVSGIAVANDYSRAAHEFARGKRINVLGGSHYSTEAFACQAMCGYFEKLGLPAQFIADEPVLEEI